MKCLEKPGSLSTKQYKKIKAVRSRQGILYGLCKVHKSITNVCPAFRPTLSAIGTPNYNFAKFLVRKLSSITFNEFTVKASGSSIKDVRTNLEIFGTALALSRPVHIWLTTLPPPVHADTRLELFETLQLVKNSHWRVKKIYHSDTGCTHMCVPISKFR